MTKQIDLGIYDNAALVDSFAKACEERKRADEIYEAHKTEFAARGMLVNGETLYGNKFTVKTTCSFTVRFSQSACEAVMGAAWMEQFKVQDEKPTWRLTPKPITVLTSEQSEKASAL